MPNCEICEGGKAHSHGTHAENPEKDTQPELFVRRMVHRMGFPYRLHNSKLPGNPDIVLARHHKVILVHGCFWHRHDCVDGRKLPRSKPDYWAQRTRPHSHEINPSAIGVQISAFKGARPSSHSDRPGYDPLLQAATGIMTRFGSRDMPLLHGIASCVDYLTGYLGAFAAVTALQARERRGDDRGDWAEASLASAAALTQLLFQYEPAPVSATGPAATGPSPTARLHHLSDGWIFAESARDISADLAGLSVGEAIDRLRRQGNVVAPIRSIAALKARYLQKPSPTIRFRTVGKDGLRATMLEPTWFQFDATILSPPDEPPRPGADAREVLQALGFDVEACRAMLSTGSIGGVEWSQLASI